MQIRGTFMQRYAKDIDKGIDIHTYFLRNNFVFIIILRQMSLDSY